jgi:hypothetical protein
METIPIVPIEDALFSLDDIGFRVKRLSNWKDKDIEGYYCRSVISRGCRRKDRGKHKTTLETEI